MEEKVFREFGYIGDYSRWDDTINEKAQRFYDLYRVHPNILLASGATFDKIDGYLRRHPANLVFSGEGDPPPFEGLSSFIGEGYELECCLDADQKTDYFLLVYDEAPDFGGEEIPNANEEYGQFIYKRAG